MRRNRAPKRSKHKPSEGCGRQAKKEGQVTSGRSVAMGEVPRGSNIHSKRMKQDIMGGRRHGRAR